MDQNIKKERRKKKLASVPTKQNGAWHRYFKKAWARRSRQAAIRAFCIECVGFNSYEDVKDCTCPECSLYEYRIGG